jgi:hypothetical protein
MIVSIDEARTRSVDDYEARCSGKLCAKSQSGVVVSALDEADEKTMMVFKASPSQICQASWGVLLRLIARLGFHLALEFIEEGPICSASKQLLWSCLDHPRLIHA